LPLSDFGIVPTVWHSLLFI